MNRLCGCAWGAAGVQFLAAIICWSTLRPHLLPGGAFMVSAAVLAALALYLDPETRHHGARQHRREDRAARILADHHQAESDRLWAEFWAGERLPHPGMDDGQRWDG